MSQAKPNTNPWLITFAIMLGTFMQVLDTTIATIALPHMRGTFGASIEQVSWVLTSYIVATAIMTLPIGYLANQFGRRNVILYSMLFFVISSMMCGFANSLEEMIVWRIIQGMSGASLGPLSQAILLDTFPKEQHTKAMGIWGIGIIIGPILGPVLGGWLTDAFSWRWVFFVNLPFGIISLISLYLFIPDTERKKDKFDFSGFFLLSIAVASVQLFLDRGEQVDWLDALEMKGYIILTLLMIYIYWVRIFFGHKPFYSNSLFTDRNYVSSLVCIIVISALQMTSMALLPAFLQQWQGYTVSEAGLIIMPRGIGMMISMMSVSTIMRYVDTRWILFFGFTTVIFATRLHSGLTLDIHREEISFYGFIQGLGIGVTFVPVTALAYSTLKPELRSEAASLFSLCRYLGGSIGVSYLMSQLSRDMWVNQQELAARINVENLANTLQSMESPKSMMGLLQQTITFQSAEVAYANSFFILTLMIVISLPMVFLIKRKREG